MEMIILMVVAYSAVIDFKTRKIPNYVTFPFMIVGLLIALLQKSFIGLTFSLTGILIGLLIFIIPYALGLLGAGDVKLMMGIGAWVGPSVIAVNSVIIIIVGGVLAFISLMVKVHPLYPFKIMKDFVFSFIVRDIKGFFVRLGENSVDSIPYGIAILGGTVVTICLY